MGRCTISAQLDSGEIVTIEPRCGFERAIKRGSAAAKSRRAQSRVIVLRRSTAD
jgi:hypothetical protein